MNDDPKRVPWSLEELRVLTAIYFSSDFSIGDDARDECRAIADAFGRRPASIDRQWRNIKSVTSGADTTKVGRLLKKSVYDYLSNPKGSKALALRLCDRSEWPLKSLVEDGRQSPVPDAPTDRIDDEVRYQLFLLCDSLEYKIFSTGSQGFFAQRKIVVRNSRRFQCQISAVLVKSKDNPTVQIAASQNEIATATQGLADKLQPKLFNSGRRGYYVNAKLRVGSERFQTSIQAVEIGGAK